MSFEIFPYTNFHELNLDWIVQKLKEAYSSENPPDYPVKSVNGMTGDVILAIPSIYVHSVNGETGDVVLYRNPLTQFPATDETRWNLFRICDGTERGIEFDADSAKRIAGTRRILIYDEDNPPDYPVTSVNGQTGDVQVTAGVQSVNGKTGNVVTPFVNPNTDILTLDSNSPSVLWGISRNVAGGNVALYITTGGTNPQAFIRYIPDGGQAINLPLLTNADIPEGAGVVSVNGKSGVVQIYGSDIQIDENNATTIATQLNNVTNIINTIKTHEYAPGLIANSYVSATNGEFLPYNDWSRTDYISCDNYTQIKTTKSGGSGGRYNAFYSENKEFISSFLVLQGERLIAIPDNAKYVCFSDLTGSMNNLTIAFLPTIESTVNNHTQQISALQASDSAQSQQITALQTADTTHAQQISALQSTDSTHDQQITSLQNDNVIQTQQISALQASDNTQTQQIAELQTKIGTGIKEVKLSEVVTLPARYPDTGTDTKITANSECMLMELSRPGVQHSDWTIETFDGYLTIAGTIRGLTDITLYLI